jgi:hypothetical protein
MGHIHPLVSEGDGSHQNPFVIIAPGYGLAAKTERDMVELICGANYDDIVIRREYPEDSDICETVVRDGTNERTICFDLKEAREGVASRRHLFDTPEGRAAKAKTAGLMADIMAQHNQQRGRGCILVIGFIIGSGAGLGCLSSMIKSL